MEIDLMLLHLGSLPTVIVSSVDMAREIFKSHDLAFSVIVGNDQLLRHPTVLKKLQKEVREILKGKQDITDNDLDKMHYLKAVIKETLRYHTQIPFMARVARDNLKIMGYDIALGTMVIINAWALGRDHASWIEPEKFMPERFLNSSLDFKGQEFGLIPFGAGRRGCPGIAFAMASVELVLANLIQKFEWDFPNGTKGEELDIIEHPGVSFIEKILFLP